MFEHYLNNVKNHDTTDSEWTTNLSFQPAEYTGSPRKSETSRVQPELNIGYFFMLSVFWAKFMWTYAWTQTIHDVSGTIDTSIVLKYPNPTCKEHRYSLNKEGQISHMIWLRHGQNKVFFIKGGVLNAILKFVGIKF